VRTTPDDAGRAAHDSQRVLPATVSAQLYARLTRELGTGPVLDVGAGSGVVAVGLAGAGARPVLTDVVDWRISAAARLPFVHADAAALPVASGTCTGVHLARVLHHVPDWGAALTEAVRVLAATGTLCLSLGDRPVADSLRDLVAVGETAAVRHGLRPAEVAGPDPDGADAHLAALGWSRVALVEFGADVPTTPREVLTGALGNPFRWAPGTDLTAIPRVVADVLAAAGVAADVPVRRDRTVRYRAYHHAADR
jgi:SAM-dependent methyltransferase